MLILAYSTFPRLYICVPILSIYGNLRSQCSVYCKHFIRYNSFLTPYKKVLCKLCGLQIVDTNLDLPVYALGVVREFVLEKCVQAGNEEECL